MQVGEVVRLAPQSWQTLLSSAIMTDKVIRRPFPHLSSVLSTKAALRLTCYCAGWRGGEAGSKVPADGAVLGHHDRRGHQKAFSPPLLGTIHKGCAEVDLLLCRLARW